MMFRNEINSSSSFAAKLTNLNDDSPRLRNRVYEQYYDSAVAVVWLCWRETVYYYKQLDS